MTQSVRGLLAVVIAVVVATGLVVVQSRAPAASATGKDQFQLDLIIETGKKHDAKGTVNNVMAALSEGGFTVDSFFDVTYASNIGSSGEDGVRNIGSSGIDGFTVHSFDSFFDITYKVDNSIRTVPIELVALSLRSTLDDPTNPQTAIDFVENVVETDGGNVYYGHVTVLK